MAAQERGRSSRQAHGSGAQSAQPTAATSARWALIESRDHKVPSSGGRGPERPTMRLQRRLSNPRSGASTAANRPPRKGSVGLANPPCDHRQGPNSATGGKSGSPSRARTCDTAVNSRLLYQLSYRGLRPKNSPLGRHVKRRNRSLGVNFRAPQGGRAGPRSPAPGARNGTAPSSLGPSPVPRNTS